MALTEALPWFGHPPQSQSTLARLQRLGQQLRVSEPMIAPTSIDADAGTLGSWSSMLAIG
jgi:hypothetical protein